MRIKTTRVGKWKCTPTYVPATVSAEKKKIWYAGVVFVLHDTRVQDEWVVLRWNEYKDGKFTFLNKRTAAEFVREHTCSSEELPRRLMQAMMHEEVVRATKEAWFSRRRSWLGPEDRGRNNSRREEPERRSVYERFQV